MIPVFINMKTVYLIKKAVIMIKKTVYQVVISAKVFLKDLIIYNY
jgi:hypothetical protein